MSIKVEMQKNPEEIMELLEQNTNMKIQEIITNDIKSEVEKSPNMTIADEQVLEDDSILLTISLG